MDMDQPGFWLAVLQIIWIDVLLSGDNAVVIALACRKLPPTQRMWGIVLGTIVAISLRVFFTGIVTTLMTVPYVMLVGGVLLAVDRGQTRSRKTRTARPIISSRSTVFGARFGSSPSPMSS